MVTAEKNLSDAFHETLKDVYYTEKQSVKACKKSAKVARSPELKAAFATHGEESATHVERLVQVFELFGSPARAKTCDAMQGVTAEMEEDLEEFGNTPAGDAVQTAAGRLSSIMKSRATACSRPGRRSLVSWMRRSCST